MLRETFYVPIGGETSGKLNALRTSCISGWALHELGLKRNSYTLHNYDFFLNIPFGQFGEFFPLGYTDIDCLGAI
jgi:hypothetical protein